MGFDFAFKFCNARKIDTIFNIEFSNFSICHERFQNEMKINYDIYCLILL